MRSFGLAINYALWITPGLAEDRGITNVQIRQLADPLDDACLALRLSAAPQPFRSFALAAGIYARLRHIGPCDGLEAVTHTLVDGWLPASEWQLSDCPTIHQIIHDPDTTYAKKLVTDMLLPLTSYPE